MIQVLENAQRVLEYVAGHDGATFTDIRNETGMNKATLSHMLKSLIVLGFLERRTDGGHTIGLGIVNMARGRLGQLTLHGVAEDAVRQLAEETRETVTVGVLRNGERYNLAKASIDRSVAVDARIEQRPSPYDTATGRALLAFLASAELDDVVSRKGLPTRWPGVETRHQLDMALAQIRDSGKAVLTGTSGHAEAVAVPIIGLDGAVCASVGVAAPCYRLDAKQRQRNLSALIQTRDRMEQALALHNHGGGRSFFPRQRYPTVHNPDICPSI